MELACRWRGVSKYPYTLLCFPARVNNVPENYESITTPQL